MPTPHGAAEETALADARQREQNCGGDPGQRSQCTYAIHTDGNEILVFVELAGFDVRGGRCMTGATHIFVYSSTGFFQSRGRIPS